MITEVVFPAVESEEVFGFSELGRRHGDFATVGVAVRARRQQRGLGQFDVVIFGSEPTPLLCPSAADLAIAEATSDAALSEMADAVAVDMNPIGSHQGRPDTKRRQAAVLLARVLKNLSSQVAHG